ncbi:hypothetical protein [Loigolactobacillus rennini]|uniref:Uncharacterized protein n=1 Tax=Loigolactobacillus rennini DSM 20253 TaxID=1423796 RepID=A0A0R2CMS0_9LACO|nr:hypothetical protein [Loigolactobacillus rennini]KRM92878.1 hypothetical protein FC24_GL000895 [Loigolactobacillus rennini DSM 20253]
MWGEIMRLVQVTAKRAPNLPQFLDQLMVKMGAVTLEPAPELLAILDLTATEQKQILTTLYDTPQWIILLVRDRIQRERLASQKEAN